MEEENGREVVVYCNVSDCLYNEPLPEGEEHYVGEDKRGVTPFTDCSYKGTCSCKKLFFRVRDVVNHDTHYEIPECMCFSLKVRRGHMDFSRFPSGGQVIG